MVDQKTKNFFGWEFSRTVSGLSGFQARRGPCREPTPVTLQYAAFQTYKAARFHRGSRERGSVATRGASATIRSRAADRDARICRAGLIRSSYDDIHYLVEVADDDDHDSDGVER